MSKKARRMVRMADRWYVVMRRAVRLLRETLTVRPLFADYRFARRYGPRPASLRRHEHRAAPRRD